MRRPFNQAESRLVNWLLNRGYRSEFIVDILKKCRVVD